MLDPDTGLKFNLCKECGQVDLQLEPHQRKFKGMENASQQHNSETASRNCSESEIKW